VSNIFEILRAGIDSSLLALGRASVHDLRPTDVIVPTGFAHD
jgi:L-lactate dehydrogenase (cytochrome)